MDITAQPLIKKTPSTYFKFVADNTQAEWGINGYNTKSGEQYLIRTSNSRGEVSGTDGDFNKTDMFLNMHSHWQKDDKSVASGYNNGQVAEGDWRSVNRTYNTFKEANKDYPSQYPNFYIYHVNNRQIYRFTPLNPSIPGRKIKTYEDLYK